MAARHGDPPHRLTADPPPGCKVAQPRHRNPVPARDGGSGSSPPPAGGGARDSETFSSVEEGPAASHEAASPDGTFDIQGSTDGDDPADLIPLREAVDALVRSRPEKLADVVAERDALRLQVAELQEKLSAEKDAHERTRERQREIFERLAENTTAAAAQCASPAVSPASRHHSQPLPGSAEQQQKRRRSFRGMFRRANSPVRKPSIPMPSPTSAMSPAVGGDKKEGDLQRRVDELMEQLSKEKQCVAMLQAQVEVMSPATAGPAAPAVPRSPADLLQEEEEQLKAGALKQSRAILEASVVDLRKEEEDLRRVADELRDEQRCTRENLSRLQLRRADLTREEEKVRAQLTQRRQFLAQMERQGGGPVGGVSAVVCGDTTAELSKAKVQLAWAAAAIDRLAPGLWVPGHAPPADDERLTASCLVSKARLQATRPLRLAARDTIARGDEDSDSTTARSPVLR
eukprot:TRINITY_DN40440_c0_g1_i1.p1 TRINITY_DN40440_c0_g1~~TRINITY_DN40440_c0_g1_i1.p1  ORF type:complete len:460 (+),score=204.51 TRINITY_DN40440_c0_g1_i1:47-1426(+)